MGKEKPENFCSQVPFIYKVPWLIILQRISVRKSITLPFLYHFITGAGVPLAWQYKVASDWTAKVWLAGPISMIGGGKSSIELTCEIKSYLYHVLGTAASGGNLKLVCMTDRKLLMLSDGK